MKNSKIVLMITMMVMVELSQATQSPPYKTLLIDCATKCELECAPLLLPPASGFSYLVCLFTCRLECLGKPTDAVPGCVKSCGNYVLTMILFCPFKLLQHFFIFKLIVFLLTLHIYIRCSRSRSYEQCGGFLRQKMFENVMLYKVIIINYIAINTS